jgi:phosphatidate cytidylyltransferase
MTRVVSGVVLAAVFFALVWYGNAAVLLCAALAIAALAFHEFAVIVRALGVAVPRPAGLLATLAATCVVPFPYVPGEPLLGVATMIVAAAAMIRVSAAPAGGSTAASADASSFSPAVLGSIAAVFAAVYIGLALGALVGVHIFGGRGAVVLLVATIVVSDTAQYYTGRMFGRHALAARLSPKKTIEGAIGGFVAAPVFLYFGGPYFVPAVNPLWTGALGFVLVAAGIAGDLFESMMKRAADLKDSSALIPGHGGVLDRIDALLFATPVFYLYLRWVYSA